MRCIKQRYSLSEHIVSSDTVLKFKPDYKQADIIDTFNTTSRYLDDILNINNVYFDSMVSQIYPSESSNLIKLMPLIPKPLCFGLAFVSF